MILPTFPQFPRMRWSYAIIMRVLSSWIGKKLCFRLLAVSSETTHLDNLFIESEEAVKLLGVQIDQNLDFEDYIISLLKEENNKLHALMHVEK